MENPTLYGEKHNRLYGNHKNKDEIDEKEIMDVISSSNNHDEDQFEENEIKNKRECYLPKEFFEIYENKIRELEIVEMK